MKVVKVGVIGCGLMGREFASAASRWCHLTDLDVRPEITAVCDTAADRREWFTQNFLSVRQSTSDYKELLANDQVEAVYCAVPHHLHQQQYCDVIESGKHLFGEKPFGIDKAANDAILEAVGKHPDVFVRCCSQFPFFPAVQRICDLIEAGSCGRILELNVGFLHSSDLDPNKPINWKRMIEFNGEYGVMGDLGMHVCHVPFRAGWIPRDVRAVLSNIREQRLNAEGEWVPCKTWDNATLLCEAEDTTSGWRFPLTLSVQRIAPGEMNTWYFELRGEETCTRFSTRNPQQLEILQFKNKEQNWQRVSVGYSPAYPTITGGIFEFGFGDAVLQMWAAFLHELEHRSIPKKFAGTATPEETSLSHRLFTAALESQESGSVVPV